MKTIFTGVLISIIILSGANSQSKWEIVNEGSGLSIWGIDFKNADNAWIYGYKGILKTKDGGNTWVSVLNSEHSNFGKIDFINDSIGWALTGDGINIQIYKTLDGAQTWVHQKTVDYAYSTIVNNIYTVTESSVFVLAKDLFKTIDGGTSWVDITPTGSSDFSNGCFLNADTGIVVSIKEQGVKSIFRTFNGGESWDERTASEFHEISDIKYLNDSLAYFRARKNNSGNYLLYKTINFFNSWSAITDEKYSIHECHFFDNDVAISVMEESSVTHVMKSKDGGLSWEYNGELILPAGWGWTYQFNFFENVGYLTCYIFNGGSLILKTLDYGTIWSLQDFSYPFKDVFFINEEKGFFAGGNSRLHGSFSDLIRTEDGCNTFGFLIGGQGGNYMSTFCHFISDSIGFYGYHGLMKTSDGGESWIRENTFEYNEVKDICFIDNSLAYSIIEGVNEQFGLGIYKTTNGGQFWDKFHSWEDVLVNSIFFIDENTGWVLGWSGDWFENPDSDGRPAIIKYSEDQGWRGIPTDANLPLNKIYFVDHDHGWILGGYSNPWENENQPLLLRSVDGGESWSKVEGINYFINDIYFETELHGWSVGQDSIGRGVILETFDGGLNWEVAIDSLSGSLRALHIQNGYGWAVGDNGLILKTEYTSTTEIGYDSLVESGDKNRLRNYPNPFPSRTRISYQLPSSRYIELSIYDLSGRKIATLLNESQAAGRHELEWNAEDMQPGLYLCELKTAMGKQVIKMILTK